MKFGTVAIENAQGLILAHSIQADGRKLRKGKVIGPDDIALLRMSGITSVIAAALAPGDMDENIAAAAIADALGDHGLESSAPFTGRVNLIAPHAGLLEVDADALGEMNTVDESITIATLPNMARLGAGTLAATIKIIPYAAEGADVARAASLLRRGAIRFHPFQLRRADLILTEVPGIKQGLLSKAEAVTARRLAGLGMALGRVIRVPHDEQAVARALAECGAELVLLLGASATADRADVIPSALLKAGGRIERFGMPVDPGNLLLLGELQGRSVVGLPGCARSPALNGADWILERLAAGIRVTSDDIGAMGVGGLLKEIPQRDHPRATPREGPLRVEVILLAGGEGRRMRGEDKLLREVEGEAVLRYSARAALGSRANRVRVVVPEAETARRDTLAGLDVDIIETPETSLGMAASLQAGLRAIEPTTHAVIVALADMPEVTAEHHDRLIAAFRPDEQREICRACDEGGFPGHPVLFGARFFEALRALQGDRGAKEILIAHPEYLQEVATPGRGATLDLDSPEDWAAWDAERKTRAAS